MADACVLIDKNMLIKRTFAGLPALANPELNLYLEPMNVSNCFNSSSCDTVLNLKSGKPIDLRLFQEFFLANLDGNASLVDLAYEFHIDFFFVESYARSFEEKGLVKTEKPVTDSCYRRKVVKTAQSRSSYIQFKR